MKTISKYIIYLATGALLTGTTTSCMDQLSDEFYNPDKITQPDFSLFFSQVQTRGHLFRYDYGTTFHYMRGFGKMLGLGVSPLYIDRTQNTTIVEPWAGWSGTPFNEFIFNETNVNYSKEVNGMKLLYNTMSDEEKARNLVYMRCCDIMQSYAFQRSTDLYDDIPYFEVGGAFQEKFYAAYDTQEAIYMDILNRLKQAATELSTFRFASDADKVKFKSTDILCNGDTDRWIRMANSLRLRMAMRLCHVKPDVALSVIKELVADNRMLTDYSHDIGFEEQDKTHAFETTFFRGIDERGYECGAPSTLLEDAMNYHYQKGDEKGIGRQDFDPRLFVIFQPDIHNRYIGLPLTFEKADANLKNYYTAEELKDMYNFDDAISGPWDEARVPAMYNRRTYFNFDMQFPVMGSTETNLLLAEAVLRWPELSQIDSKECVRKAIDSSTRFYYTTNANMKYGASSTPSVLHIKENATAPSLDEKHLAFYKDFAAAKYAGLATKKEKLSFLFQQKMLHMNIMNPYEIYNEARRLVKDFGGELPFLATPNVVFQERMFYPANEQINNPDNFAKVAHKNNYSTPVWWTGRTVAARNKNGNAL